MSIEIKQVSVFLITAFQQKEPLIAIHTGVCLQGSLSPNSATVPLVTPSHLTAFPGERLSVSFGDCQAFISCREASTFVCVALRNVNHFRLSLYFSRGQFYWLL